MRLYEIDYNLRILWDKIAEQDGDLTEEDIQALNELELAKNDKLEGYGVIIREIECDILDCQAEMKRIKEICEKKKKAVERLRTVLKDFMNNNDIPKFESLKVNISFRKSKSLEIDENAELPKEFLRIKEEPDKTAITDYIKSGGIIEGCRIVEKDNIQIK